MRGAQQPELVQGVGAVEVARGELVAVLEVDLAQVVLDRGELRLGEGVARGGGDVDAGDQRPAVAGDRGHIVEVAAGQAQLVAPEHQRHVLEHLPGGQPRGGDEQAGGLLLILVADQLEILVGAQLAPGLDMARQALDGGARQVPGVDGVEVALRAGGAAVVCLLAQGADHRRAHARQVRARGRGLGAIAEGVDELGAVPAGVQLDPADEQLGEALGLGAAGGDHRHDFHQAVAVGAAEDQQLAIGAVVDDAEALLLARAPGHVHHLQVQGLLLGRGRLEVGRRHLGVEPLDAGCEIAEDVLADALQHPRCRPLEARMPATVRHGMPPDGRLRHRLT